MFEKMKKYFELRKKEKEERKNKKMDEICFRTMIESGFFDGMVLVSEKDERK